MKALPPRRIVLAAVLGLVLALLLSSTSHGQTITSPDTSGDDVGQFTSLALDSNGNPVVSYYDVTNGNLKVLHCNDRYCVGGDESIQSPDTGGDVGKYTSLALDSNGYPVVSYYYTNTLDLKLLHCNDPNCAGDESSNINSPDTVGFDGKETSLALDSSGNPVVSYRNEDTWDLIVLHCDDPNCAGDESSNINSPDTVGSVGRDSSLALDGSGYPVVSYYDATNDDLKVMHCNDPNCAGDDESITSPDTGDDVGLYTSLALDGSGYPVVSYRDVTGGDLKVLHCDDVNCADDESSNINSPDTSGDDVGLYTSLALDDSGYPVVSYYDATNDDLKVLHCDDVNCAGDESSNINSPDTSGDNVGLYTSLALDGDGFPVVSYYDVTNANLKVLRYVGPAPVGGIAGLPDVSDSPARNYAALAALAAAALLALGAGGWYARRRCVR